MKFSKIFTILVFLLFEISVSAQPSSAKRVILIVIGGVSAEAFQYADTPEMNSLVKQGVISLKTRGVMPSLSAPNLATILSGAGPEQHGVTANSWSFVNAAIDPTVKDADGYFTSIFTVIRKQMPKAVTAMFYDREWLGTYLNKKYISKEQFIQGQVMITSVALNYIKKEKPIFTFIYYGLPDETARSKGFNTKEYFQSIHDIDTEIGKIVNEIKADEMAPGTTIIITSDHGVVGSGDGGESLPEIEVPWIINGPGIKKNSLLEPPNDLANTAPTIAKILGLKTPSEWIGKCVNDIFVTKTNSNKTIAYVPKPWCSLDEGAFPGPQQIELSTTNPDATVYYTLDGTVPGKTSKKYISPFTIKDNCTLRAVSISGSGSSQVISRIYTFVQGIKSAELTTQPNRKHPGSGVSGLFDGLIGSANPANKQWMGFDGDDFEVTFDLGEAKSIGTLGVDVLQLTESGILIPSAVEFYVSGDGINFKLINTLYPSESGEIRPDGPVILIKTFDNLSARYIRIKATNAGTCPPSLPCAGQKAWLFVSEIEIE